MRFRAQGGLTAGFQAPDFELRRQNLCARLEVWGLIVRSGAALLALVLGESLPARAQPTPPLRLTLDAAIRLALKQNLSVRVARAEVEELAGTRERRHALLLPRVSGDALANRQNVDLAAMGITFPGVPSTVGPFNRYDFRLSAGEALVDRHAYHGWKAATRQEEASKLDYQDAREVVVRQAGGLYLEAQAAAAEVVAAESRVSTSEALEKLARDQHRLGLATAVDEVRAQVQLSHDQQTLLVARNASSTSLLALAHYLGIRPGTSLVLAEPLEFHPVAPTALEPALTSALEARSDYASLLKQRDALVEQQRASRARYLPTLSVNGDYGAIGQRFGAMAGTGEVQGTLTVTLFDRDRAGERVELESRVKRLDSQIDDLRLEIEQEVRKAMLDLDSSQSQVAVAEAALRLAERELSLAQDRFRNGVTDNIEVITAQASLAAAQDDRIRALAQHADSVMALARALGGSAKSFEVIPP